MTEQKDSLQEWLSIRTKVNWAEEAKFKKRAFKKPSVIVDGHLQFIDTQIKNRNAKRADEIHAALKQARVDAKDQLPLDFQLLSKWQKIVLAKDDVSFRTTKAFSGGEWYGVDSQTQSKFEQCLAEANATDLPVFGIAARTYLDVNFFHPFEDGNARASTLALDFLLARQNFLLSEVRPLFVLRRSPTLEGARAFLQLLQILMIEVNV